MSNGHFEFRSLVYAKLFLFGSPQKDADFTPVHEDETLGLVGDVRAHSTAYDAMPGRQVHGVEFSFDYLCDVVKNFLLCKSKSDAVNGMLLHGLTHICELYDSVLSVLLVNIAMGHNILFVFSRLPTILVVASLLVSHHTFVSHLFNYSYLYNYISFK